MKYKIFLLLGVFYFISGCSLPRALVGYFWDSENKKINVNLLDGNSEFKKTQVYGLNSNCFQYAKESIKILICSRSKGALIAFEIIATQKMEDPEVIKKLAEFKKLITIDEVKDKNIEVREVNFMYDFLKE